MRRSVPPLRSHAREHLHRQVTDSFDCQGQVPTRGLMPTRRYILGAVFVYQLTIRYRHETSGDLRQGL